jgi:hypothetical protein
MSLRKLHGTHCVSVIALLLSASIAHAQDSEIPVTPAPTRIERRINDVLNEDTRLEFISTPLFDVKEYLEDLHSIPIELDVGPLKEAGIGAETPITRELKGISLRSALDLMFKDLEATWVIRSEVLLITSRTAAATMLEVRIYDVSQILVPGASADGLAQALADALRMEKEASPASSDSSETTVEGVVEKIGNAAKAKPSRSVGAFQHMLIVRDTVQGHHELLEALKAIRASQLLKEKRDADSK